MNEAIQPLSVQPLEADFTSLSDLCWCPRLYYNHIELGLVPIDAPPAIALAFGDGFHQGIEELINTGDVLAALAKFDEVYSSRYEAEGWDDTLRTPYIGRVMLCAYYQKWGVPQVIHHEVGAAIELDDVLYYGKVDQIRRDDWSTVADVKTTSGLFWLPPARLNWQLVGYAYMARELTGIETQQVAIDAVVIPKVSQALLKKYGNELPPEHEFAFNFHENLHWRSATITPRDYEEWQRWVRWNRFKINLCRETNSWPMEAPRACMRFGRSCEFSALCKAENEEQELRLREGLYKVERWRPFEYGD